MKRNHERWIWIGVTSFLGLITAAIIFGPQVLAQSNHTQNRDPYLENFEIAYYTILENYVEEVDPAVLYEAAMNGMFESLEDPYSQFIFEEQALQNLSDTTSGEFGGVGLYIGKDYYDKDNPNGVLDYVKVVAPIEGTPAYKLGIRAGDIIYAINGESAKGYTSEEVSQILRGKPGTDVDVTFLRNEDITFTVTITRAKIEIPTVKYDIIHDNIGYLRIIQFTPFTAERTKEALEYFKTNNCTSYVIDLRSNPGGLLSSVLEIADFFFDGGVIVSTKSRIEKENETYKASRRKIVNDDIPIVILIDNGSASASEILTGAMKDRGRATVFGTTSYGKAAVQQVMPLGEGKIKLTTSKYLTPAGNDINKKGITPDVEIKDIELSDDEIESYKKLIEMNKTGLFLKENPDPTEQDINVFIEQLNNEGIILPDRFIRMMIKQELTRTMDSAPVYDLEFDTVLIKAVEFLEK